MFLTSFSRPAIFSKAPILALALSCTLLAAGCGPSAADTDPAADKKEDKSNKNKENSANKDPEKSEDEDSASETTSKDVEFKLSGEPIDKENLRIVIHPEVADGEEDLKLGTPMIDEPAKFKDGILKVTIPPVPDTEDLGEEEMTILLTTIFVDSDESEDYSEGDLIVASVGDAPVYSRPGSPMGEEEWLHIDSEGGGLVSITGPLEITRLDDNTEMESLEYSVKTDRIPEKIGAVATVSLEELPDFSKNFQDAPRVLASRVDRDAEVMDIKLTQTPDKARQSKKLPADFPKFEQTSLSFLAGFEGDDEEITAKHKLVAMGCIPLSPDDESDPVFMVVANLWVKPGKNWVNDPRAAFDTVSQDYRPGWNGVGMQLGDDGSIFAAPLLDEDYEHIHFDERCALEAQALLHSDWASLPAMR